MSERFEPMTFDDLEARLADLASALAFPTTPDLATAIGSRLRASAGSVTASSSAVPSSAVLPRPSLLPFRRSVRRSLLLAAALALLVVGAAFAVRFGLEFLSIELGPLPSVAPAPSHPPGALGADLRLGEPVALEAAEAAAPFEILVPADLGAPDAVYLGGVAQRGQVALVYTPRDGLPASSLLRGAGVLVTQNRGTQDEGLTHKLVDTGLATITPVNVDEAFGLWISGEPHFFWYLAPDGTTIEDSRRFVGDTLVWERDGILYRIEGAITLDRALEIARSMR
jgi:hypothetical protein